MQHSKYRSGKPSNRKESLDESYFSDSTHAAARFFTYDRENENGGEMLQKTACRKVYCWY